MESELARAFEINKKRNNIQSLSVLSGYRAQSFLLQARLLSVQRKPAKQPVAQALEQAGKALDYSEKTVQAQYPYPRDFVRAYWLLGEALLLGFAANQPKRLPQLEIRFYDEPFQQQIEALLLKKGHELQAAERCLGEALEQRFAMIDEQ
jgi:hypothetical protein